MTKYFNQMFSNINAKVNQNRQEMKTLAERVRLGDQPVAEAPQKHLKKNNFTVKTHLFRGLLFGRTLVYLKGQRC